MTSALLIYAFICVEIHLLVAICLVGYSDTSMDDRDDVGFGKSFL